jgi:type I restriction enzyme R subunit
VRQHLGVDENTVAIYSALRTVVPSVTADQARMIDTLFLRFPDYLWNNQQAAALRSELYKALRPLVPVRTLIDVTNTLLKLQRV